MARRIMMRTVLRPGQEHDDTPRAAGDPPQGQKRAGGANDATSAPPRRIPIGPIGPIGGGR